jgi:voltage-gated potassium channel
MTRYRERRHRLVRRGLWYSLALCLGILLLGGLGFWALEPAVLSLQDGLWLAFTTAATVGYGDTVPHTPAGRAFAVLVVLLGLAVLSLVTASLAAIFVENDVQAEEHQLQRELMHELHALRTQVQAIQQQLDRRHVPSDNHTEKDTEVTH